MILNVKRKIWASALYLMIRNLHIKRDFSMLSMLILLPFYFLTIFIITFSGTKILKNAKTYIHISDSLNVLFVNIGR